MFARTTLTVRLTVLYTLVSAVVLSALAALVLYSSQRHFIELDRGFLNEKAHWLKEMVASGMEVDTFTSRLEELESSHHGFYLQAWRGDTRVFGVDTLNTPRDFLEGSLPQGIQDWEGDGRPLRGIALQLELEPEMPPDIAPSLRVILAVDIHHHFEFLQSLAKTLATFVALATLVSGALGWWAARTGLAPLRFMREQASKVTADQLHQRMPVEAVPVEMADLAAGLNEMLIRLEDDFARLQDFSSDLAHELRTPINNLLTQTQVCLSQKRDPATYQDVLASNAEEFQRLARMISDMLFLAKSDNGMPLPHPETVRLEQEVQALFDFYDAVAEDRSIHLQVQGEASVVGDRLMLRRAISNLLSNALRYGTQNSTVKASITTNAESVILCIENTGKTIDPEHLPRLFDRFYRADKSRSRPESDGTGLGLAITQAIMSAHSGSVDVTSCDGTTRFLLRFTR
ncbi:heavy metal sensor histidine kinase [Hydrogenophaga aquatica]